MRMTQANWVASRAVPLTIAASILRARPPGRGQRQTPGLVAGFAPITVRLRGGQLPKPVDERRIHTAHDVMHPHRDVPQQKSPQQGAGLLDFKGSTKCLGVDLLEAKARFGEAAFKVGTTQRPTIVDTTSLP